MIKTHCSPLPQLSLKMVCPLLLLFFATPALASDLCTYNYGVWHVGKRKTVRTVKVSKPRSQLSKQEMGPLDCTPCIQDQINLKLSNGVSFQICEKVAGPIMTALETALANGFQIKQLVGYRPSMSRGKVNAAGERTILSNHAFGVAIDINQDDNGLYDNCITWGSKCRLIKGGRWNKKSPLALHAKHPLVLHLLKLGFKWGGQIAGKQKDMMHFSTTGY